MNGSTVVRVIALLWLIVAAFMIAPLLFGLAYGEADAVRGLLLSMGGIGVVSGLVLVLVRPDPRPFVTRQGYLLVSIGWLSVAALGAIPFVLGGAIPSYTDAFFETMSGFTTTGASILTDIESLPRSLLFWRSLTHWLGGMGIVVLTVAILPLLGVGGLQLIGAESPGPTVDKFAPKVAATAKILWLIYLGLTVLQTLLLLLGGLDLFDSLTHTFGTLATGGFSPRNASVAAFDSAYVDLVITVFMVAAGINFALYYRLLTGRLHSLTRNTELRAYLVIFVVASLLIAWDLNGSVSESFRESLRFGSFQAASILTTTGYATADFNAWPAIARTALFALMFIGGSTGSTGGGIKVMRIVTLFKQGWNELNYLMQPRGVFSIRLNGLPVRKNIVYAVSGFVALYLFLIIVTTVIVASTGASLETSLTTALATLGNIGPGLDAIGPTGNYAFFPGHIKWILSIVMMLGRLELYTVLVLFSRRFWRR